MNLLSRLIVGTIAAVGPGYARARVTHLPSPEYALLIDAISDGARRRVDPSGWGDERWNETLRIAEWHRLSPVLSLHLASVGGAPEPVTARLERSYLANAARNMFVGAALMRATEALAAAEVAVVLLKGAALVESAYPDPAAREMLDLDLLVPPDLVGAATSVLDALGYHPSGSDAANALGHHDEPLVGDEQLVAFELHRHITLLDEGTRFDINEIWERARPAPSAHHLLPAPEDLLIHVCVHFTRNRLGGSYRRRHTGGALAQVCDIARIVQSQPIDWDQLTRTADQWGLSAMVFLALFAARELGARIPAAAVAGLTPPGFDPALGRRLVTLRVLRDGNHLSVRSARWMLAPSREALARGWSADTTQPLSLVSAYVRRARAHAPLVAAALREPWAALQDRRLNREIHALKRSHLT